MLELKKITKSYLVGGTKQQVLKGIDIQFRKNEFTSILGTSGSGKTTLLNIIGGLDHYDDGDLIIDGVSTKKYRDRDWDSYRNYRVGFIFQSYNLIMHQTVLSNVEIALTLSGVGKEERKRRAIEALKKVGLEDHINKKPNQLSGGQMQRVAIARALVNDPEIILADEPTGALDSKTSIQIMDLLKEVSKDKLVIMVTHNPELAHEYSSRIIELKDGLIINDSNPYKEKEKNNSERTITKTSMSLLSALQLSYNNLLTKMGRTILTAFAGSIGIIGIALILSLSNGVNKFAKNLEKDSLADYPISIEKVSYDIFGSISMAFAEFDNKNECGKNELCSTDDIVKNSINNKDKGLMEKNNIKEFISYLDNNKKIQSSIERIDYKYNFDLQVYSKDYSKVNPSELVDGDQSSLFKEITKDLKDYKLIKGDLPKEANEIVLVIGENNTINDSILYSLGIKDKKDLQNDLKEIRKNTDYKVKSQKYSYEDIIGKELKLLLNTDYYKEENGVFIDYSNNLDYLKEKVDNGKTLKIVGIIKEKDSSSSYLGYTHDLTMSVVRDIQKTSIYEKQMNNPDVNVLTGLEFDGFGTSFESLCEELAIYDEKDPSSISIYLKDFDAKKKVTEMIDQYNEEKKKENREDLVIHYSDLMKSLVGGITNVVNIVSFVLIGFVAISLIVSSIMIAIITYISVLERTKEIGILRAIGASKKDVKRVFFAETIIEGFVAGVMGIVIALIISLPINAVVAVMAKLNGIASMRIDSAIFLILLSVGLNVLAGAKPASMAAKKDPVEALRTE